MTLGVRYKNDHACANFVKYVARGQQEIFLNALSKSNVLASRQMPVLMLEMWSLILYFDSFSKDGRDHIRSNFFNARHLVVSGTGER